MEEDLLSTVSVMMIWHFLALTRRLEAKNPLLVTKDDEVRVASSSYLYGELFKNEMCDLFSLVGIIYCCTYRRGWVTVLY